MGEVKGYFGTLGLPAAMTLVMLVVYRFVPLNRYDGLKTGIVVFLGICLSVVSLLYEGVGVSFVTGVDCFFYGIQLGATSIGLYKVGQAAGIIKRTK